MVIDIDRLKRCFRLRSDGTHRELAWDPKEIDRTPNKEFGRLVSIIAGNIRKTSDTTEEIDWDGVHKELQTQEKEKSYEQSG